MSKPVNVEKLADKVATKLGGVKTPAKGDGYKILIPNKKNDITVRVMKGGGRRSQPYYRVSMEKGGSVDKAGNFSAERLYTHIEMNAESLADIIVIVSKIKG